MTSGTLQALIRANHKSEHLYQPVFGTTLPVDLIEITFTYTVRDYFPRFVARLLRLSSPLHGICADTKQEISTRAVKSQTGLVLRLCKIAAVNFVSSVNINPQCS